MKKLTPIYDKEYVNWIADLKKRYRQSQIKAAISVNSELLKFYFELGRDIVNLKAEAKYGSKFYKNLANDLTNAFNGAKSFTETTLRYCKYYHVLFSHCEQSSLKIHPQVGDKFENNVIFSIPWGHIKVIIDKVSGNFDKAMFYVIETFQNNWSRSILEMQIDSRLYERQGKAINNFEMTLPKEDSDLAKQLTKDPYCFDFLGITQKYNETELKICLIDKIQKFLLELGTGFAFIGKEYRIQVEDTEMFLDLLFYHVKIHAYVVIEIKVTDFKPEFVGQLGTYTVAVDELIKSPEDKKTIGLLVCKYKNSSIIKYALKSSNQPIGVSAYELSDMIPDEYKSSLPTIEELEAEINN